MIFIDYIEYIYRFKVHINNITTYPVTLCDRVYFSGKNNPNRICKY